MKKPLFILFLIVIACALVAKLSGATVTFNLTDFLGTVETLKRKQMIVQPLSTVRANNTNIITSERRFYNTGTNALVILTNMNEGLYRTTVWGGSYTSVFHINIPDTNGVIAASDYLTTVSSGALETEDGIPIDIE